MAMIRKTSKRMSGPHFKKAAGGTAVRTGKTGGKNLGTPKHCPSTRAASNVRPY